MRWEEGGRRRRVTCADPRLQLAAVQELVAVLRDHGAPAGGGGVVGLGHILLGGAALLCFLPKMSGAEERT